MRFHLPGMAGKLAIVTLLLVGSTVVAVSVYGIRTLRDLADAEGLARAELAAASAQEMIRENTEDVLTATGVLGDRPTLRRLLTAGNNAALEPYLDRYCDGAMLDGCALTRNGDLILSTDETINWNRILAAANEQGDRILVSEGLPGVALAAAIMPIPEGDGTRVLTTRKMDRAFADRLGERVGLEVRVTDYANFRPGDGYLAVLNSRALSQGKAAAQYVPEIESYVAAVPIASSAGDVVALMHALLPAEVVMEPVDEMARKLLGVAVFVAVLASACGILIGRNWIAGVYRLTDAARRLGSGDLAASIPSESGKELAVLGSTMEEMRRNLVDLTGELRRREAEAQAVLGGIVEGVYAVDMGRRIRFLNPKAEGLLRVSAADAIGRFCGDVLQPKRDARGRRPCDYACPIIQARRQGQAEAIEQIEPVRDRSRRVVIASSAPSEDVQVQVLRDETELEAVRRTRDSILANISHEFRTPLAAQLASIELLRDGLGHMEAAAQRDLVFSLERGAVRLTWLIDNLLESVRIEADQLAIRRQQVRLDSVFKAALELIGPLIDQRGQTVEWETTDDMPPIRGDHQRLTQVVVNLLANASKFGPPGSRIRIGSRIEPASGVVFWIEDEGEGPADPHDQGLFDRFHRSAASEDLEESGLGLGLFIVRSIVERHGGKVRLSRTAHSRTRTEVELPAGQS